MSRAGLRQGSPAASRKRGTSSARFADPIFSGVGRQVVIVFALLVALGVPAAAMAWSTAARGDEPEQPEDVQRVERAASWPAAKRGATPLLTSGARRV